MLELYKGPAEPGHLNFAAYPLKSSENGANWAWYAPFVLFSKSDEHGGGP